MAGLARLVSKELKLWDPNRTDVFAPSTCPAMSRLVPALVASNIEDDWCMWGRDSKDAFLTVDQRSVVYVLLDGRYYKVLKCLPGQRCAGAWWADQISRDLLSTGLKQNPSCPVAFGKAHGCCTIHVDDGFLGGQREVCQEIVDQLQEKYTLSVTGPISKPGERVRFLKRIFTITEEGILMQSDPKYVSKMIMLLGIHKPRARKVPCGPDICSPDCTQMLDGQRYSIYRACVGGFLYLSPDRCDVQFSVSMLARKVQSPTERDYKMLRHLVEYLWTTEDYGVLLKWSCKGQSSLDRRLMSAPHCRVPEGCHLLEVYVDSDWAGTVDRHSMSSCQVMLDGNHVHGFVRKQATVALSSCESELIAAVSGGSEGLYINTIVETLGHYNCVMVILIDNSSARMLLHKSGCSRVRHLDCRLLWTQQAVQEGRFKVGATPTRLNLADLGTKPLGQDRILLLLGLLGYCNAEGPLGKSQIENQERAHRVAVMCRRVPNSRQMHGLFAVISALSLADGVTGVEGAGDASNSINSNPQFDTPMKWFTGSLKSVLQWVVILVELVEEEPFLQVAIMMLFVLFVMTVLCVYGCAVQKFPEPILKTWPKSRSTRFGTTTRMSQLDPNAISITPHGECFHRAECSKLKDSEVRRLRPCKVCKPERLLG